MAGVKLYRAASGAPVYDLAQWTAPPPAVDRVISSDWLDSLHQTGWTDGKFHAHEARVPPTGRLVLIYCLETPTILDCHIGGTPYQLRPRTWHPIALPASADSVWITRTAASEKVFHLHVAPALLALAMREAGGSGGTDLEFANPVLDDELLAGLGQWAFEITGRGQPPRLLWDAIAMAVAHRLVDLSRRSKSAPLRGGLSGWVQQIVLDRLHQGFAEDLTIAELAALAGLSPFHFARAFRKSIGVPPRRYLTELRLAKARRLLTETDMSVGDIAAAVGYSEPSVLARLFRQELGVTPTAYRRRRGD